MTQPIIELKNIEVKFGNQLAVQNVNLTVDTGDIYGIIGYSGAGKSTLVRTINLLQKPTSGEVLVNGENLLQLNNEKLRDARKKIGMIFQHFNLLTQMTVFENVLFALRNSGKSKLEKQQKVSELLELVDLADKRDSYPSQLSGGQKQRVAIARALANDPDVLISDEATSALDPKNTELILALLQKINRQTGLTIVLITHQMEAVKQICNKVSVMEDGQIIESNSLLNIFAHPKNALTREFINTTTRLDSAIENIFAQPNIDQLLASGTLLRLSYAGDSTDSPLIATLFSKFNVVANILYGNVENLQGTALGNLIVILSGDDLDIHQAMKYLAESEVEAEILTGGSIHANN